MLPARFEPAIPASERSQTHALDHPDTGIGFACARLRVCLCRERERKERIGERENEESR